MRTHVVTWKWEPGKGVERKYTAQHVDVMTAMIRRNSANRDVRVVCVTDDPTGITQTETYPLWSDLGDIPNATKANLPSCYRRLKLYDVETQRAMGIVRGERIISLDLDAIVCQDLRPVYDWQGEYVGWALPSERHGHVYNGSFQMFTAGTLRDIWLDFDPRLSPRAAQHAGFLGSDQSWLSWKLVNRPGCSDVPYPMFASYPLHCRRLATHSAKTKIVFFHGSRKPWDHVAQNESQWIRRYWRP